MPLNGPPFGTAYLFLNSRLIAAIQGLRNLSCNISNRRSKGQGILLVWCGLFS